MTDEPKKGLFSSFKKKDNPDAAKKGGIFSRFGKKKDEDPKPESGEKQGLFSRFGKKKDAEAEPQPVQPPEPVTAKSFDEEDTAYVQPSQWVKPPQPKEDDTPTAELEPKPTEPPAEQEPTGGVFGTPATEDKPVTSVFGSQAQFADTAPMTDDDSKAVAEAGQGVEADTADTPASDDDSAEEKEEKKGFLSRFKRNKDGGEDQGAEDGEEGGEKKPKFGFFKKLKAGLSKTSTSIKGKLQGVFLATRKIDEDLLEEIEEMLISTDIGVQTSMDIIEKIRLEVSRKTLKNGEELKEQIKQELLTILDEIPREGFRLDRQPTIILVVGVNGVGKTTTIGKLARNFQNDGKSVVVCAADTFRAAAMEQLEIWAKRADVDIVMKEGAKDPATVVYDALERVKEKNADVLLIDTAGRLHNNPNLMKELSKVHRIIGKSFEDAPHNVLLILDAVTGQNGLQQAKQFVDKVGVTDLIITKLDGTAKGGIAVAITKELNLPIQYIGVGEQMDDLLPFKPTDFVNALFDEEQIEG